jgi:RNA polymerase sigma factor (sigma-70 family)
MSRETISPTSDSELVARYAASLSPEVFAQIVARHGGMVLRTCVRLTGDLSDAEDAAQATFLVLAQKAGSIRDNLAGWLHKVARDSAQHVVRERLRRLRRERESAPMKVAAHSEDLGELREEIDAALVGMPDRIREAVVLRYLEGRSHEEAARLAGCNVATFRWRSMKGLAQLRAVLARRGTVVTTTALVVFLTQEAAASAATAKLISWAATATAAAGVGLETGRSGLIAQAILNTMSWAKVKLYAATTAVTMAVAGASVPFVLPADEPLAPVPPTVADAPANRVQLGLNASLGGWRPFPDDNPWNTDISREPVDPNSDTLISTIGRDKTLFPSFGTTFEGVPNGISYWVVGADQPRLPVRFQNASESDPGPYPIPPGFPVITARRGDSPPQLIVIDRDEKKLYEVNNPSFDGQSWHGLSGAIFDLKTNAYRPAGWTSADAAGLPVFPGLVRYDEVVEQKAIRHALRFTCRLTRAAYVAPARHWATTLTDPKLPPMGMRVRLKADYDISGFPPDVQVILTALKKYGMILAEHGSDWYLSGAPDPRWNEKDLKTLQRVRGDAFEVVRMGKLEKKK